MGDVVFHREPVGARVVVPFQFDACVEVAFLVDRHFVVVLKRIEEVVGVALNYVFNAKTVHYYHEDDWPLLVSPEARSDEVLVASVLVEAFVEELLGEAS